MDSLDGLILDEELPTHLLRLRNQERVELIMSFYRGLKLFRDLARKSHAPGRRFRFDDVDRLIEMHLRLVKDSSHHLFRMSKRDQSDRLLQAVFDMYFGILFHILLKAKENIRLQENYNIKRLENLMVELREIRELAGLPPGVGPLFDRLAEEFERDSQELEGEMERARFMFGQLEKIFNRIIQVYNNNPTIIRGLFCQKEFFAELFPPLGIDRVFARIYPKNGPAEAYFFIGFDYLRSAHLEEAHEAFSLAMQAAQRMPHARLRQLYRHYRGWVLETAGESGDAALAIQLRLRDIESRPPLSALAANDNRSARRARSSAAGRTAATSRRKRA